MKRLPLIPAPLISVIVVCLLGAAQAATYYVDCSGSDSNNGTSPASAWQTLAKVNASSFNPGDSILLKSGCQWRQTLAVPSGGSAGNPVTFSYYGGGALPVINGADVQTGWMTGSPTAASFGNTAASGNTNRAADYIYCMAFTPSSTGTLTDFKVNFYPGGARPGKAKCALYTNASGAPGALVANTTSAELTSFSDGWNTFTVTNGAALQAGTTYWMAVWGTQASSGYPAFRLAGNATIKYQSLAYGSWPGSFTVGGTLTDGVGITIDMSIPPAANIYNVSLAATPNQVFLNGARAVQGASKAALTQHQWFYSGGTLSFYDSGGNPDSVGDVIEASTRNYCVDVNGKNYITVDHLCMGDANLTDLFLSGASSGFTATNNKGVNAYYNGASTNTGYASTGIFSHNEWAWNGSHGIIILAGSHDITIDHESAHNNSQIASATDPNLQYSAGIRAYCEDSSITNLIIQYCDVHDNGRLPGGSYVGFQSITGGTGVGGVGIWLDTIKSPNPPALAAIVRHNHAWNNLNANIKFEFTQYCAAYYNLVHGAVEDGTNGGAGILVGAVSNKNTIAGNDIRNNTSYGNAVDGIEAFGFGNNGANGCLNNTFENNISTGNGIRSLNVQSGCEDDGTMGSGNQYLYNAFGAQATGFIRFGTGYNRSTYTDWEAHYPTCITAGCSHSVQTDPQFVNPSAGAWAGFAPGNPALRGAGYHSADIGAVPLTHFLPKPENKKLRWFLGF